MAILKEGPSQKINETNKSMKLINQCFSSFYKVKYLKQLKLYSAQFVNDQLIFAIGSCQGLAASGARNARAQGLLCTPEHQLGTFLETRRTEN